MSARGKVRIGAALSLAMLAGGVLARTSLPQGKEPQAGKNPISTKPEGTAPSCSYTGGVADGKATSSGGCVAQPAPGTDPNLMRPHSAVQQNTAQQNTAQRFPFPGGVPAAPAASSGQTAAPAPDAPGQADKPGPSANQRFPFPGETQPAEEPSVPAAPQKQPEADSSGPPLQDAGSSGSSSNSSSPGASSSSSGQPEPGFSSSKAGPDLPDDDPDAPMPTPQHHSSRKKLPAPEHLKSDEEKEAEDVQVAGFYQDHGNFMAAYLRAQEAVSLQADDAEAHLALAEAARKLGKLDEAKSQYTKVIALDPVPKTRKVAERALKEMSGL